MKICFILFCLLNLCCVHGAQTDIIVTDRYLIYPNYRNSVLVGDDEPWSILLHFSPEYKQKTLTVYQELTTDKGVLIEKESHKITVDVQSQFLLNQVFKNKNEAGSYLWNITIEDSAGKKDKYSVKINLLNQFPSVYVGKDGFMRIDNEKFFPFGIYTGTTNFRAPDEGKGKSSFEDLKIIKDGGYNIVLSYFYGANDNQRGKVFLENAEKNDLKVIYSVKDFVKNYTANRTLVRDIVSDLKDQKSLLAWYTNDEMQNYGALDSAYNDISALDKEHPVYQVTNMLNLLDNFYPSTDIIATDPYPIGDKFKSRNTLDNVTLATLKTTASARKSKASWQVLQLHNLDFLSKDKSLLVKPPTLDQMRNMSYQALVNGAKGLIFFAYHWLYFDRNQAGKVVLSEDAFQKRWQDIIKLNNEIKPLTEIILKDNNVDLVMNQGNKDAFRVWEDNNIVYLVVVNNTDKRQSFLKFDIPKKWRIKENKAPNTLVKLNRGKLSIVLEPVACGVITFDK